ncbi:MAG: hypothetical protein AAB478_00075 [Patescibacteria group bacterium]
MRSFFSASSQNRRVVLWLLATMIVVPLGVSHMASAGGGTPHTLSARQFQQFCAPPAGGLLDNLGVDVCDISNFTSDDTGRNLHFVSPDPLSATASGDWTQHCPTFSGIPDYVSVEVLNLQTMEMEEVDQSGNNPVCEAYFILTDD